MQSGTGHASRRTFGAAVIALAAAFLAFSAFAATMQATDIAGRTVAVKKGAERIILGEGRMIYSFALLDLGSRRIAYVGGRAGLIGHSRGLVPRANGVLIHHDGGVDDSTGRLGGVLDQADAVLCPVDCVSHRACLRAKQFCKRAAKRCAPLRSAGLSSFVSGLHEVLATKPYPPTETIKES